MPARKNPTKQSQSLFAEEESRPSRKERAQSGAPTSEKSPESGEAIIAYVDGGARGNPGPAGYGVYIRDAQGKMLAELSEYLGHKTNNFAEYSGLLAALEFAVKQGHARLQVVSDSELMVKQMLGIYKVRSPELKQLYERARTLVRKLTSFEISHVLRAKNKDADRLANEAMDRGSGKAPVRADEAKETSGIVRGGVVEFFGEALPEGTRVKIKAR